MNKIVKEIPLSYEVFKLRDECRALYNNLGSHKRKE